MSKRDVSRSTSLPLASSPHCRPMTQVPGTIGSPTKVRPVVTEGLLLARHYSPAHGARANAPSYAPTPQGDKAMACQSIAARFAAGLDYEAARIHTAVGWWGARRAPG